MIDKRLLVDEVTIAKVESDDKWGKASYAEPITLSPIRFDRSLTFTGSANHRSESKPSVLFVYPKFCPIQLDDTFLNALVNDGKRDYIVRQIIPQYHPFKKTILCYEVEVV